MNFVTDQGTQGLVDELVPRERPFTHKFAGNHDGLEMGVVVAHNPDERIVKSGSDLLGSFCKTGVVRGAQCTGKAHSFPTPGADCV